MALVCVFYVLNSLRFQETTIYYIFRHFPTKYHYLVRVHTPTTTTIATTMHTLYLCTHSVYPTIPDISTFLSHLHYHLLYMIFLNVILLAFTPPPPRTTYTTMRRQVYNNLNNCKQYNSTYDDMKFCLLPQQSKSEK